ncbi:hypothetical protein, partial [Leptospira ellisii]|uniref:hypothetical protein n=1 Tax=Leptospira ellisii TaxID=2023197 RepID=UPI0013FE0730
MAVTETEVSEIFFSRTLVILDMTETFFETLREQTESRSKLSGIFERVIRNAGELETVIREQSSVIEEVKEASVSIGGATQL